MMRFFTAHVRNGRLVIDEPADLPEGTRIELVQVDVNGGDLPDAEKRAKLARELNLAVAEQEAGQLLGAIIDEHVRWYQESMPDSPTTRDVITAATSDLPVLRWLGRRRIAATINARAKRLGIAPVSLSRWIGRRKLPPVFLTAHVCNRRLVLEEPTEHPDGTLVELVPTDSVMWLVPPDEAPPPDDEPADEGTASSSMQPLRAHVRDRRLVLDEPTDLPDGTAVELISIDVVVASGGYLLDDETRVEFEREMAASFDEEERGQLIDAADALADLKLHRKTRE